MRVLVADDDELFANRLASELYRIYKVEALVVCDGALALEWMVESAPDAALLDAVMPMLDGPAVVKACERIPMHKRPVAIIATYPGMVQTDGDFSYIEKPFDAPALMEAYRVGRLMRFKRLLSLHGTSIGISLKELGLSPRYSGYRYLCEAVIYAYLDANATGNITGNIYEPIALRTGVKAVNVERCVRHAIETAWSRSTPDIIESHFGNTIRAETGKPTNAQLIALLADKLRMEEAAMA